MDEVMHTVFLDKFRAMTVAMLIKLGPQIIGDANVERSVSAASENVDAVGACAHGFSRPRNNSEAGGYGSWRSPGRHWYQNKLRTL
jgi:hypothetical protein